MLLRRTLRPATLLLATAGLSCVGLAAQTTENSSANNGANVPAVQPAPLPAAPSTVRGETLSRGGSQVVPVTGETKIHGSTVPAAMMPRQQESLGDAARRLRKHKKHYYGKNHAKRPAKKKAAARQPFKQPQL